MYPEDIALNVLTIVGLCVVFVLLFGEAKRVVSGWQVRRRLHRSEQSVTRRLYRMCHAPVMGTR